jgi:hypothetical protein
VNGNRIVTAVLWLSIVLGVPVEMSSGAQSWYEAFRNANWGLSPPENNGYLLQRLSAYSNFHVNGRVRFFVQPMSAIEAGRNSGPRPAIDESRLFFEQAFADITVAAKKENSLVVRLGRQEFVGPFLIKAVPPRRSVDYATAWLTYKF